MVKTGIAMALVVFAGACGKGKSADPTGSTQAAEDYAMKSKAIEAELQLNKLGKEAKVFFLDQAKFPEGTAAVTPTAKCCAGANKKCAVTDEWTKSPVWQALEFQIDEPTYFQYSYTGTPTAFTATAVGDLDCDGTAITYTLTGSTSGGNPKVDLAKPEKLN